MNRIITVMVLILILTTVSAEVRDLTSEDVELDLTTESGEKPSTSELRILQAISKLEGRMAQLEASKDECIKPAQYSQALESEQKAWDGKFNDAGVQFVIAIIVGQVFFWSSLFLLKSKGWF